MVEPTGQPAALREATAASGASAAHAADQHPERHEHADVSIRALVVFFVVFVVFAVASHIGLYVFYESIVDAERAAQSPVSSIHSAPTTAPIPLQGIPGYHANPPARDMEEFLRAQEQILTAEAPAPQTVEPALPIDAAMDRVLESNLLPVRPTTQPHPATTGVTR